MRLSPHHSQILTIIIILSALLPGLFLFVDYEYVVDGFNGQASVNYNKADPSQAAGRVLPVAATSSALRFLFFGDLMLDRHIGEKLQDKNLDYLLGSLFSQDDESVMKADLVGANLEGAVTDGGLHYKPINAYDFAFPLSRIEELKKYGFNFFNLANNHISDQGDRGLKETRDNLRQAGFYFSGDTDAAVSQDSVQIINLQGRSVALLGLSMVYHHFDLEEAQELVRAANSEADIVIVNIHWGTEYQHQFSKTQQSIGRALIDSGADIIIGHHPHVVQGMEIYQGKPIFYSLGNFIFDQYFSADTQQGLAVKLTVESDRGLIDLLPLQSRGAIVNLMTNPTKDIFLSKYADWSKASEALRGQIIAQSIELESGLGK